MKNKETGKKVVVTGGAGFVGSHIAETLFKRGYEVHVIDTLVGGKKENLLPEITLHIVDIRDLDAIKTIIKGADTVFHCAALPRVQFSIENPRETFEVNATGTLNVLIAAKEGGVRRVVYSASSSAYGDQEKLPLTEDMPASPQSPYGLQKYIGEINCKMWNDIYGLETVSLRYFNVYGPRLDPEGAYALVIGKFLAQRSRGEAMTITGDGKQTRDFTHVSDVVDANLLAMDGEKVGKGDVINIGRGQNCSINDLAELIGGPTEYVPARLEPHDTLADNSKAKELLGWNPSVALKEGIDELKEEFGIK